MKKSFILLLCLAGLMSAQEAKWHPNDLLRKDKTEYDSFGKVSQKTSNQDKIFIGIEGGYERVWDSYYGFNTANYGIKVGYILNGSQNRIYVGYNRNSEMKDTILGYEATQNLQKILLGLETVYAINNSFGLISGGAIGWAYVKAEIDSLGASVSESALAVGIKIGGIYEINDNNEVEFGAKAGGNFFSETIWNAGAYIGYNFKF